MVFTQKGEKPKRPSATASWTFSGTIAFQELCLTKARAFVPIRLSVKGLHSLASWQSRPLSKDVNWPHCNWKPKRQLIMDGMRPGKAAIVIK